MTRLGDNYKLTLKSEPALRVSLADDLEEIARAAWLAARHAVEATNGTVKLRNGRQGVEGPLTMSRLISGLLPEASKDEVDIVSGMVRQVLRRLEAAICTSPAGPRESDSSRRSSPTWWVADELPEQFVIVTAWVRDNGSHAQELRMIQEQARKTRGRAEARNETRREPAPVTTTQVATAVLSPRRNPADALAAFHDQQRALGAKHRAEVLEIVKQAREPLTAEEVDSLLDKSDRPAVATMSATRGHLRTLTDAGEIFCRVETKEERTLRAGGRPALARRASLYSAQNPVPARTIAELVPGVTLKSSADWSQARSEDLKRMEQYGERIFAVMTELPLADGWTRNELAKSAKCSREDASRGLAWLKDNGFIRKNASQRWVLVEQTDSPTPQPPALTGVVQPPPVEKTEPVAVPELPASRADKVHSIMALVESLAAESTNADELAAARGQIAVLDVENSKLRAQVAALKAAIATLS